VGRAPATPFTGPENRFSENRFERAAQDPPTWVARQGKNCVVRKRWIPATALALAVAGCVTNPVGPVGGPGTYAVKAAGTVADARAAVGTAKLAASLDREGRSLPGYTTTVVDDAVTSLQTAQDTFESIAPPDDDGARALRPRVLDSVAAARRALVDTRAAVQTGDDAGLDAALAALGDTGDRLDALRQELP
jgi:hypothetical protein